MFRDTFLNRDEFLEDEFCNICRHHRNDCCCHRRKNFCCVKICRPRRICRLEDFEERERRGFFRDREREFFRL